MSIKLPYQSYRIEAKVTNGIKNLKIKSQGEFDKHIEITFGQVKDISDD